MTDNRFNLFEEVHELISDDTHFDNDSTVIDKNRSFDDKIIIGISNHHIHLSKEDCYTLFGEGYELTPIKDLKQPGQFACKETVTICGPKGSIEKLRILGPFRKETQVEVLYGDCFKLGIKPEVRLSGDLDGTSGVTVTGKKGSLILDRGVIVAKRHVHMLPNEAEKFNVTNGEIVKIKFDGVRGNYLDDVIVRVSEDSSLECHIDVEEANAMGISPSTYIKIIKNSGGLKC